MSNGKFLIVEDEFVVAETLRTELASMGYEVMGLAASGEEALSLVSSGKPDLVLMDIKLRGEMDGVETAIHLRQKLDVPCLFLTAFADEKFLSRSKLAEPLGYLVKPYDSRGLRAAVEIAYYKARMERLLKESESRFRSMFENSPVAYLALDASGNCLDSNPEFCELLGYEWNELIGKPFVEFWAPETQHPYQASFAAFPDHGKLQMELELIRKDRARLTVVLEGRVQRNMESEFLRMHCILHNISERKRGEAERLQLSQQLQQVRKAESLNCMAGAIAHHFNNMLTVVMGNLELIAEDLPGETPCTEQINSALNAAGRASEISSFMLTYMGHLKGNKRVLDLCKICDRIVPKLWEMIPSHIRLLVDFSSPGLMVDADTGQVAQVLTQLINNAREAIGDKEGEIRASVRAMPQTDIARTLIWPVDWKPVTETYVALQVADTGCGICASDIDKVMDPFFSTKFTGRGMGLAMVLGIARAHNAAVSVQSTTGVGSLFQVLFPLSDQKPVTGRKENDAEAASFEGSGRILLVDDEEMVRKMAKTMLERIGFDVLTARDGVEAVKIFRENQADIELVLSDLTMPRMNGWETLSALREICPDIPVILASGYDEAQIMADDHRIQPQAFLHKPYQLDDLKKALAEALTTMF
jgi:two-component system, cell cycle sensor histidine kinase and response regulator CckA